MTTTNGKSTGDENAQPPVVTGDVLPAKAIEKAKPSVPIVNGIAKPDTIEGMYRLADLFCRAGITPQGVDNPESVMVALMAGAEIGLSPTQAVQNIMVTNGRPTVWGDAALAVCRPLIEDIEETITGDGDAMVATCRVKRKGAATETVRTFSVADAKTAKLWNKKTKQGYDTPWVTHPKRMLQMRARAFALRDSCPDALKGLGIEEEVGDYITVRDPSRRVAATVQTADVDLSDLPQQPPTDTAQLRTATVPAANGKASASK